MDALSDIIHDWGCRAFGQENFNSPRERSLRLLEEALELVQAEGINVTKVNQLVAAVYERPIGKPEQEIGGVLLTMTAYIRTRGWNPHQFLLYEVRRVLGIPIEKFRERNKEKIKANLTEVKTNKPTADGFKGDEWFPPGG